LRLIFRSCTSYLLTLTAAHLVQQFTAANLVLWPPPLLTTNRIGGQPVRTIVCIGQLTARRQSLANQGTSMIRTFTLRHLYVSAPYYMILYDTSLLLYVSVRFIPDVGIRFVSERHTATKDVFVLYLNLLIAQILGFCFF
jgi:hypothetical protein